MKKILIAFAFLVSAAFAQDTARRSTSYAYIGTTAQLPASCPFVSAQAFVTDAAAGQNIYMCIIKGNNYVQSAGAAGSAITALTGDATATGPGSVPITLASVVGSGSCGDATHSCSATIDAKGRITAFSNNVITAGGSGTVTVVAAGALTANAIVTGGGTTTLQTNAPTATMDSSGNISTPGSISSGSAGGVTGFTNYSGATSGTVKVTVAAIAGTWTLTLPASAGSNGQFLQTDGSGISTWASGATLIASGTSAMGTGSISSAACATAVTTTATGTATTDAIIVSVNGDPTAVTGYIPSTNGSLYIWAYPTANNVNFKVCNNTTSPITPGAITLNWRVVR